VKFEAAEAVNGERCLLSCDIILPNRDLPKVAEKKICSVFSTQYFSTLNMQAAGSSNKGKRYSSPVTGLEWPTVFQEVKVPRFLDNGIVWW
jgi:hypothetical protein